MTGAADTTPILGEKFPKCYPIMVLKLNELHRNATSSTKSTLSLGFHDNVLMNFIHGYNSATAIPFGHRLQFRLLHLNSLGCLVKEGDTLTPSSQQTPNLDKWIVPRDNLFPKEAGRLPTGTHLHIPFISFESPFTDNHHKSK
jgi:hypothetical protein